MKKPELLSPAGTVKNMRYAAAYGADAVYAGQPRYSLRIRNNGFDFRTLAAAVGEMHAAGKKLYMVVNIQAHNLNLRKFKRDLADIAAMGPDALIMSDPGLIMTARDAYPDMPVHLSVQANALNHAAVRFWERAGIARVILSRELSLDEIAEIRNECPDVELEAFVHGALCMAYSGRCLLSGYLARRDANRGACTNSCRWRYRVVPAAEDDAGGLVPAEGGAPLSCLLEEATRPGELMPCDEDAHGTYIMNSRDLRAVEHVARLCAIGVDALKIEGRTKSFYYCARTASVYRRAIDAALRGEDIAAELKEELESLANRGYTGGFFTKLPPGAAQNLDRAASVSDRSRLAGEVTGVTTDGLWEVAARNRFELGDTLEIMYPGGRDFFVLDNLYDAAGRPARAAPGEGHTARFRCPLPPERARMAIVVRHFGKRDAAPRP